MQKQIRGDYYILLTLVCLTPVLALGLAKAAWHMQFHRHSVSAWLW